MRICFFSRRYFPAISGMSVYAQNFLHELVALGHEVTMISQYRGDAEGTRVYGGGPPPAVPGVRVLGLEALGEQEKPVANFERDIETMVQTAAVEHARAPFDLLHAQYGYPTGLAALETSKRLGLPNVVSIQGGDGHWVGVNCCGTHREAMRVVLDHAGALLIGSQSFAHEVHQNHGTPLDRFTVVPNAVDMVDFQPRARYFAGQWINAAQPTILYHGRIDRRRGALDLLDAFALLRQRRHPVALQARLLYAGVGPDSMEVLGKVNLLGLGNAFTNVGYVSYENAPNVYRAADIFVSPTHSGSFSHTILEAMSAGLPVISCKVTGVVDYIRDGINGLLVPPGNFGALANALARLLDEQLLRFRLSERARREVREQHSSWADVARQVAGVYDQVRATQPDNDWTLSTPPDLTCRFRGAPQLL